MGGAAYIQVTSQVYMLGDEEDHTRHEEKRVHQLLMGLNEVRFGNVVTNIISMKPLILIVCIS